MFDKVRKPIVALASLLLAAAFTFSAIATTRFVANAAVPDTINLVDAFVPSYVLYGGEFKVGHSGYKVSVEAPDGTLVINKEVLAADATVTANQVGMYVVTYYALDGNDFAAFTYNVESYMKYEYLLVVDGDGSAIPSVWKASDTAPTLPSATLYYYDEDERRFMPSGKKDDPNSLNAVKCIVTDPLGVSVTYTAAELATGKKLYDNGQQGVYYVTYFAELLGGRNVSSVQYTTQLQNIFTDSKAPTMTISGVSSTSSVNAKNTLPTATLTDDYDERVNVSIRVTHAFDGSAEETDVPDVVVDPKTGYAKVDDNGKVLFYKNDNGKYAVDANGDYVYTTNVSEAVKAVFDNSDFMDFYPTEEGVYKVTYSAMDSTGKILDKESNKTKDHSYTIKVSDTTAPVFEKLNESLIPTRWGMSKVCKLDVNDDDADGDTTDEIDLVSRAIEFPVPEVYDNASAKDKITCAFTLTDPNSKQILAFEDILATTATDKSKNSTSKLTGEPDRSYYFFKYWEGTGYTVNEDTGVITGPGITGTAYSLIYYDPTTGVSKGFFDFDLLADKSDYLGRYSVTYRAKDEKGISASKSFDLSLQDNYFDLGLPSVDFTAPEYIAFRNYESVLTIKNVSATDADDSRLDVEYYLLFNNDGLDTTTFDDFEEANVIAYGDDLVKLDYTSGYNNIRLKIENDEFIATVENEDKDEQEIVVDTGCPAYVAMRATDSVGNTKFYIEEIQVIDGTAAAGYSVTPVYTYVGETPGVTDVNGYYTFGSFYIDFGSIENRNYTGFELYVKQVEDRNGRAVEKAPLTTVSFETYSDNRAAGTHLLHVDNIRFKVSASGKYMVVTRGFNVSGDSSTVVSLIDIETYAGAGSIRVSSSTLSDELDYGTTYNLPNDYFYSGANEAGVLRAITGGRMSLMGTEFTALQGCSFSFVDYVFEYGPGANLATYDADFKLTNPNSRSGSYSSRVDDKEKPVFEVLGTMPTYAAKDALVTLPAVSASSANGKATKITCKITDKDGNSIEVIDSSKNPALDPNVFQFRATKDGNYTVSYTAVINDNETTTSYTIACGDITAPEFTVDIGYINSSLKKSVDGTPEATVGDLFDFAIINVTDEDSTGYTYSKTLLTPENEEVSDSKITDNASKNNGNSYELTLAGTYTVVYKVTDKVGNTTTVNYYITVTSSSSNVSSEAIQTLAIVLIIVGVLIIAGVVIYFVRFRKRKA